MTDDVIRLAGLVEDSIVDGPGLRLTVFTQGCPHRCPGCHNPETHDPAGGREATVEELAEKKKELNRVAHEMGTEIAIPFMFLSFICLAAIPAYAITDCGFIDVAQQKVIDPVLEVVE